MGKLRLCLLCLLPFQIVFGQNFPIDTIKRHGFVDYKEAADTLWSRLAGKKVTSLKKFTVSEKNFILETRRYDTAVTLQMIHGEWLIYWYHVDKSFKKVFNGLKKEKIDFKKAILDTVLLYKNKGSTDLQRVELYFVRNKKRGYIKFQLWQLNDLWYFSDRMDFVEDPMPVKLK